MPPRSSRPSTSRRLRGRPSRCRSLVMRRRGVLAGLLLVLAAAAAPAAERIADPTREFVGGYDPSQNDFFANTPERTVLLRIRDDLDGDGVADLALSESSTWGQGGGPPSSTASSSRTGAIRRDAGSPGSVASPRYTCRP